MTIVWKIYRYYVLNVILKQIISEEEDKKEQILRLEHIYKKKNTLSVSV